jgi:addiction module HigA family antidote
MINRHGTEVPAHPGALLRKRLTQLGQPTAAIARLLGLSRQTLYEILAEKQCVTPRVALRLAKLTASSAEMWLDLQQKYDLALARRDDGDLVKNVPVLDEGW